MIPMVMGDKQAAYLRDINTGCLQVFQQYPAVAPRIEKETVGLKVGRKPPKPRMTIAIYTVVKYDGHGCGLAKHQIG